MGGIDVEIALWSALPVRPGLQFGRAAMKGYKDPKAVNIGAKF